MFHLNFFLLILIASKACMAQEDWEDYFLKGECDKFIDAVAKLDSWYAKRPQFQDLIEKNYMGDEKMADKMIECLSKMTKGTTLEVALDKMRGYVVLNRALRAKFQLNTQASVRIAMSVGEIASKVNTTFNSSEPKLPLLMDLVKIYKNEALPSIKSICFDNWMYIVSPSDNKRLGAVAVARGGNAGALSMWPIGRVSYYDTEECFKWYITKREFRLKNENGYLRPMIDIVLTNVEYGKMLVSNNEGDLKISADPKGDYRFNWWTAEFRSENMEDYGKNIGSFHLYNKNTLKPLRVTEHCHTSNEKVIKLGDVTTRVTGPTYFTIS